MNEECNDDYCKPPSPWWFFTMTTIIIFLIVISHWSDLTNFTDGQKNAVALLGGLLAFICGFIQYRIGQEWKKTEFLAQEYKEFIKDRYVQRVMYLFDYPISSFQLFEHECNLKVNESECKTLETGKITIVGCSYSIIKEALSDKYDDEDNDNFDAKANIIRLSVDKFLFKLGLFQKHIESNLINAADLKHYINYWIEFIKRADNPKLNSHKEDYKKMKKELIRFMRRYDYNSLNDLLKNFGTDIEQLYISHNLS